MSSYPDRNSQSLLAAVHIYALIFSLHLIEKIFISVMMRYLLLSLSASTMFTVTTCSFLLDDPGEALYLTKYIESGDIKTVAIFWYFARVNIICSFGECHWRAYRRAWHYPKEHMMFTRVFCSIAFDFTIGNDYSNYICCVEMLCVF